MQRRSFLKGLAGAAAASAVAPLIKVRGARGDTGFKAKHVVMVSIAGGLRMSESLGMAQGATMPNLFGTVPLVSGFGSTDAGAPVIAPEYSAMQLVLGDVRPTPLVNEGALVANLRYDAGTPGHLQGAACLACGAYNNIDNRADAHPPAPTLFELHRRAANTEATDAWYVSSVSGFYRALQASDHPEFGARFGGSWLSPPSTMTELVPLLASGKRSLAVGPSTAGFPAIDDTTEQIAAVRKLTGILDGNTPAYQDPGVFHANAADNDSLERYLASIYGDPTYQAYYPNDVGIGFTTDGSTRVRATSDATTVYHAEQILRTYKPGVMLMSLIDIDTCHSDFNGYLQGQQVADALVTHLWNMIQSTDGLRDETAMLVLPEHGRQLDFNGKSPDSLGRSGLDHGGGDDGDRDVWMLALGPDFKPGVYEKTGVAQDGRTSGRYETIDAVMTAASLLGCGDTMSSTLGDLEMRPGLLMEDILR